MTMTSKEASSQERNLCEFLKSLPRLHSNRYTDAARRALLNSLFWSLAGGVQSHFDLFFPSPPPHDQAWSLRSAQGGEDGAEYTEAARGKACGHIFRAGEAIYRCKTCSVDDTCVICSRCYDSSDHPGHMIYVSVSLGNSGCCDCGDAEAWKQPVHCGIHSSHSKPWTAQGKGKGQALPPELLESIRMTIGRSMDYVCDVISCSPERLRLPKSKESVEEDERLSRLTSSYYDGDILEKPVEYALLLWNDEKHTVPEVTDQVARACKVPMNEAYKRAMETDDMGRSIVKYSSDISEMLRTSRTIEQIKVTTTIRSARDTFREQMCGTIVEWLNDIAGCTVGDDYDTLRQTVCGELLKTWSTGSLAIHSSVGEQGIDDHEKEEHETYRRMILHQQTQIIETTAAAARAALVDSSDEEAEDTADSPEDAPDSVDEEGSIASSSEMDSLDHDNMMGPLDTMSLVAGPSPEDLMAEIIDEQRNAQAANAQAFEVAGPRLRNLDAADDVGDRHPITRDIDGDTIMLGEDAALEVEEATMAGYPPPPPPPPVTTRLRDEREQTPSDSDTAAEAHPLISDAILAKSGLLIPRTPRFHTQPKERQKPGRYWLETSPAYFQNDNLPTHEDLQKRTRLDWLILFDLRMWKRVRIDLRDLYISIVATIPAFKRILGLRFAGLYTTLAQLYLIADREPDHSIITISLQMLTTASITAEIVERGNFLTNLMAILFTFLTTRQVGHPHDISPNATLAFDTGSVTNRRMYHFFMDLKHLFNSEHVQAKIRENDRYILQFLDLVKLHQGICPNVRAVGDHVEYETDAWISASLITREVNRLCRQFAEAFRCDMGDDLMHVSKAIRYTAKAVMINCLGAERKRFIQAEIKEEIKFKNVGDYEFDTTNAPNSTTQHSIVKFKVDTQPISFHHALHYTLSWLIECGKSMTKTQLTQLLTFSSTDLRQKPKVMGMQKITQQYTPEDHMIAAFDFPLRVCAWLAQMKASMWVRNGMSLRHQQGTYRGVSQRDVSHHRDIFLLQTAMVTCPPARVLVSMIDRYCLEHWMKGLYEQKANDLEDTQVIDVVEEMIHLLIILLSDRVSLLPGKPGVTTHTLQMRRDITHVLCFKPLAFSEICARLPDKFQDQEECPDILEEMTNYKAPEGLSDVGTFELKPHFLEDIDPYIAHYNKNQREESENAYKKWIAKKTGVPATEVVFEPRLQPIDDGAFSDLAAFTRSGIFAQIIYYSLLYPLKAAHLTPSVPATRVEAFLQVVLHLVLLAVAEDKTGEDDMSDSSSESFIHIALTSNARSNYIASAPSAKTIVAILEMLSRKEELKACHSKITLVLKRMKQKRPQGFEVAFSRLGIPVDRVSTASPAQDTTLADRDRKKRAALERQAKVMAQFQQQQQNFLDSQGDIDWGEDGLEDESEVQGQKQYWPCPSGACILCQEETGKDGRLYGTFALITMSNILRQTNFKDVDYVREVGLSPLSLDRSAEAIRPFGLARENREQIRKVNTAGEEFPSERQFIGKGFGVKTCRSGPVSVGCGHIMHYRCFEQYIEATKRRHNHQIARHHPERLPNLEFVCPLCKALGNAFLPIAYSPKEEIYPGPLMPELGFQSFLDRFAGNEAWGRSKRIEERTPGLQSHLLTCFYQHNLETMNETFSSRIAEVNRGIVASTPLPPRRLFGTVQTPGKTDVAKFSWKDPIDQLLTLPHSKDVKELLEVYLRLRDTIAKNSLPSHHVQGGPPEYPHLEFYGSDTLAKTLGFSISSAEIQQRGVGDPTGTTLLGTVPQQTLTNLRLLCEATLTYVSIPGLRNGGDNGIAKEYCKDYERQYYCLFQKETYAHVERSANRFAKPLLHQDSFIFLTECSLCLRDVDDLDTMHLVRLCYVAEVVKVILEISRNMSSFDWLNLTGRQSSLACQDGTLDSFAELCRNVNSSRVGTPPIDAKPKSLDVMPFTDLAALRIFVRKYALTYLRKVVVLLHIRFGVAFQHAAISDSGAEELDRLHTILQLESFDELCHIASDRTFSPTFPDLVDKWVRHAYDVAIEDGCSVTVSHPVIFELIGIPERYDTLIEEVMRRRCPTTGKDISDPFLCLFCGEIFCGQSICCVTEGPPGPNGRRQKIGGAQQHMLK